jgi:HEAT repeat protein
MVNNTELRRLLSLVEFRADINHVEGLDEFRSLLEKDSDGHVLRFLRRALQKLEGQRRGGIAFVIAEHYRKIGDVKRLHRLIVSDDECVRESVLDALWGEPGSNPEMGPAIVQMAIDAADDLSPGVRTQVSWVLRNQCDHGIDVTEGVAPLRSLLKDRNSKVRQQAARAVAAFAKAKYDMRACIPQLRRNVKNKKFYVRESSAWALWQLSRYKHDISSAVPDLVWVLTNDEEYNEERKQAVGALIHHAKKSVDNAAQVIECAGGVTLNGDRKEIKRFVNQLASLTVTQ